MARRLREKLESGLFKPEEELQVIQTIDSLTKEGEKRPKGKYGPKKKQAKKVNSPFA